MGDRRVRTWGRLGGAVAFVVLVVGGCGGAPPAAAPETKDPNQLVSGTPGQSHERSGLAEGVGRITGIVRSDDGPVPNVLIEPTSLETPMLPHEEVAIVTDEKGRFVYGFHAGRWKLTTSARGYCPGSTTAVARDRELTVAHIFIRRKPCNS